MNVDDWEELLSDNEEVALLASTEMKEVKWFAEEKEQEGKYEKDEKEEPSCSKFKNDSTHHASNQVIGCQTSESQESTISHESEWILLELSMMTPGVASWFLFFLKLGLNNFPQ
jgi:hypothetical protein